MTATELTRPEDTRFTAEMNAIAQEAESLRMRYVERHQRRSKLASLIGTLSVMGGAGGFGWFFFMEFNLLKAVLCMLIAILPPVILHLWSGRPLKAYVKEYKKIFLPKVAAALGGFKFHPSRGISAAILGKTGVVPAHDRYEAEDCFMGVYKGVRVIFSEARLYNKKSAAPVFDGVFVLLKIPGEVLDGHTIITADHEMVQRRAAQNWQKLTPITLPAQSPYSEKFQVFSNKPEEAELLVGEKLLKELGEAADIFGKAALTAVLFRKQYTFLSIPYALDMFEPAQIFVPVSMKQHALQCKKEIGQILEIIDVFDLYQSENAKPAPAT